MKLRFLFRLGPWLFLASFAWYLGVNYLIDSMNKKSVAQATSLHNGKRDIEIGTMTSVKIHSDDDIVDLGRVQIVFDSSALQVTITNNNLTIASDSKIVNGELMITFSTPRKNSHNSRRNHWSGSRNLEIRLPSFINKVGFSGIDEIDLSGYFPRPNAELVLEILDTVPRVRIHNLVVHQLKLLMTSREPGREKKYDHEFTFDDGVLITNLDVDMRWGSLKVAENLQPQNIHLNLGGKVSLNGPAAFMRAAQFGKPP